MNPTLVPTWPPSTMATTSVVGCSLMNSGCSLLPTAGTSKFVSGNAAKCYAFVILSFCHGLFYSQHVWIFLYDYDKRGE